MKKDRTQQRTGSRTGYGDTEGKRSYGSKGYGRQENFGRGGKKPAASAGRYSSRSADGEVRFKKDGTPDKRYGKRTQLEKAYAPKAAKPDKEFRGKTTRAEAYEKPELSPNLIIGRNPVLEAIKSGRTIDKVMVQKDAEGSIGKIISLAREHKIQVQNVDKIALDKLAPGRPHQGVAAFAAAKDYVPVNMVLQNTKEKGEDPLLVILDGLEDPHNLGAVLRSCDGCGAHGVIIPSRRAVGLTETVAKASAGAIEYVPVSRVTNLASTVDSLKEQGVWVAAVDMDGTPYTEADLTGPLALIIGAEGSGVSQLLREKADYIISIPMKGHVNSLNASNAAAIVLYEALRQREKKE